MRDGEYMIIVIDGYNVLKQALHKTDISESAKDNFIDQLGKYGKKKGHVVLVVFDGGSTERPYRERVSGITVIHSGFGESADDWIKKYMHQHKGHDLLLVSTDRELGSAVRRLGVSCIDAMDFYGLLQQFHGDRIQVKFGKSEIVKTAEHELPELDALMHQASRVVHSKLDDMIEKKDSRSSAAHMPSKKEREMLKKLKKL